jgi:hypothetical protein
MDNLGMKYPQQDYSYCRIIFVHSRFGHPNNVTFGAKIDFSCNLLKKTLLPCIAVTFKFLSFSFRVARWYILRPKIVIWVNFGGPYNGRCYYRYFMNSLSILRPFGIFYGHME